MQLNIPKTCEGVLDYSRDLWQYPCGLKVECEFFVYYPKRNANGKESSVDLILEAHKLHHSDHHTAPIALTMFCTTKGVLESVECCA